MSRMRIANKVRKNMDFDAIRRHLDSLSIAFEVCPPTGKGHPFLKVSVPGVSKPLIYHIACTPKGAGNSRAALANLKRAIRDHKDD